MILRRNVTEKLAEIREKRTHCQCSRAKIIEKEWFNRVIKKIDTLPEEFELDFVTGYLKAEQEQIPPKNDDWRIGINVYGYAIEVCKHVDE